jgi:hypothetical protein
MNSQWITAEAQLWQEFMTPAPARIVMHSLSPEKRREVKQALDKQKDREFGKEWEAYDRWVHH